MLAVFFSQGFAELTYNFTSPVQYANSAQFCPNKSKLISNLFCKVDGKLLVTADNK